MIEILQIGVTGYMLGGFGIILGGVLMFQLQKIQGMPISLIVALSVGLISCILILDVLPMTIRGEGYWITVLGLILGIVIIRLVGHALHREPHSHPTNRGYMYSAAVIALAIAIHNLPVGLALGSSMTHSDALSWQFSVVMVVHTIPEGLALAAGLLLAGKGIHKIILYTAMVALPTSIGAIFGYIASQRFDAITPFLLAVAAGSILLVAYREILWPVIREIGLRRGMLGLIYGWFIGLIFLISFHATHL